MPPDTWTFGKSIMTKVENANIKIYGEDLIVINVIRGEG